MDVNEDFVDIAKGFIDNGVEFLIVGAYALAAHGFPRTTGDIDGPGQGSLHREGGDGAQQAGVRAT